MSYQSRVHDKLFSAPVKRSLKKVDLSIFDTADLGDELADKINHNIYELANALGEAEYYIGTLNDNSLLNDLEYYFLELDNAIYEINQMGIDVDPGLERVHKKLSNIRDLMGEFGTLTNNYEAIIQIINRLMG